MEKITKLIPKSKEVRSEIYNFSWRKWNKAFPFIKKKASQTIFKKLRITVKPGEALSLQLYYHRSEHWVVVKGTAKVVLEDEHGELREYFVHENESIYVPKTRKHRIINPGKVPLEIIEVQVGEYVEEDDIVRFEDKYERE